MAHVAGTDLAWATRSLLQAAVALSPANPAEAAANDCLTPNDDQVTCKWLPCDWESCSEHLRRRHERLKLPAVLILSYQEQGPNFAEAELAIPYVAVPAPGPAGGRPVHHPVRDVARRRSPARQQAL